VDLQVPRGRLTAIVGPSGCGKSTLLYLLGLLDRPDAGSILIDGRDLAGADDEERTRERNRNIGFVFQFHFLLPEFTALEKLGAVREAEARQRARSLLEAVGLGGKAERLANRLSGGEQQRVAIARALANGPAMVLADEPTGNLDAANSTIVFELLQGLSRSQNQAMVLVTHNPEIAARCDQTLQMRDGVFVRG
jgi:lipoprotein-releasing system ATP-binding protein